MKCCNHKKYIFIDISWLCSEYYFQYRSHNTEKKALCHLKIIIFASPIGQQNCSQLHQTTMINNSDFFLREYKVI